MSRTKPLQSARRTVLKGLAAAGALGGASHHAAAGSAPHVIVITSPAGEDVDYDVTATRWLRPTQNTCGAPFNPSDLTFNPEDTTIGDRRARGSVEGGVDAYEYAGTIESFSTDRCTPCTVYIDGNQVNECDLQANPRAVAGQAEVGCDGGGDGGLTPGVIELAVRDGSRVDYVVAVSGRIYSTRRHSANSNYSQLRWHVGGDEPSTETLRFSGSIQRFELGDGDVDATIRQRT
jgi:hypothetical protein